MSNTYYLAALVSKNKFYKNFQTLLEFKPDKNKYPDNFILSWNPTPTNSSVDVMMKIISEIEKNKRFSENLINNEILSISVGKSFNNKEFQFEDFDVGIEFSNSLQGVFGTTEDLLIYLVYENSSRFAVNNHHLSRFLMQKILSLLDAKYAWTLSEAQIDAIRYEKNPFSEIQSVKPWLIPSRTKIFHKNTLSELGCSIYELEKTSEIYRKDIIDDKLIWLSGPFGLENEKPSITELKYDSGKIIKYDDRYLSNLLSSVEENHHKTIEEFIMRFKNYS